MKTMPEYIEREALITLINDKQTEGYELCMPAELKAHYVAGLHKAKQFVEKAPTADVVEVKHGEWIKDNNFSQIVNKYKCSLCGVEDIVLHHNYCPNCGAKMDKKEGAEE